MKESIDASAAAKRISNTEWLRRAVQNEIERGDRPEPLISDADLDARIEAVLTRMLEAKKRGEI